MVNWCLKIYYICWIIWFSFLSLFFQSFYLTIRFSFHFCICLCACKLVYKAVCVCVCVFYEYLCVYISFNEYLCVYILQWVFLCLSILKWVFLCVRVCMRVGGYLCIYLRAFPAFHVPTRKRNSRGCVMSEQAVRHCLLCCIFKPVSPLTSHDHSLDHVKSIHNQPWVTLNFVVSPLNIQLS